MEPVSAYYYATRIIITQLANTISAILRANYDPDDREASIERLTPIIATIVRDHRTRVYQEAVQMLYQQALVHGVADPYTPDLSGYPEQSVETVLRRTLRGPVNKAVVDTTRMFELHTRAAGRQTIVRAVEDGAKPDPQADEHEPTRLPSTEHQRDKDRQPAAWARVLTGAENCGFCVMLASRGPVYSSARDAGRLHASAAFKDAGALDYVNSYHPGCDCVVVPVYDFGDWPGRDSYKELEDFYIKEINKKGISYNNNPLKEEENRRRREDGKPELPDAKNEVIAHLDKVLKRRQRDGEPLPFTHLQQNITPAHERWRALPRS